MFIGQLLVVVGCIYICIYMYMFICICLYFVLNICCLYIWSL